MCLGAVIEQRMPMSGATMYWMDTLDGCNLDRPLALPYDRYRLVGEHRSGRSTCVSFDFGEHLSDEFVSYASSNGMSVGHLALGCYYVLLLKLTNGERDICVGMNVDNRSRDEVKSVIGLFENTIPLRCEVDPKWCLVDLIGHVGEMMKDSETYSHYPVQRILAQHPNSTKHVFLDILFGVSVFENPSENKLMMIGDARFGSGMSLRQIGEEEIVSNSDLTLTVQFNASTDQFSCTIDASLDLFDVHTIERIAQRFHTMFNEMIINAEINSRKPIYKTSLMLSDEHLLLRSLNNTQVWFRAASCTHHEFVKQALDHPQKLAIELDDQSLSYSELLYCAQVLSLQFLNERKVHVGDVICQCVERSLSMVRCSMKSLYYRSE